MDGAQPLSLASRPGGSLRDAGDVTLPADGAAERSEQFLLEASRLFNSSMDIGVVLQRVVTASSQVLGDVSAILLLQDIEGLSGPGVIHMDAATKRTAFVDLLREQPLRLGKDIIGGAVARDEPLIMDRAMLASVSPPGTQYIELLRPVSVLVVPLRVRDVILGALVTVSTHENREFTSRDVAYCLRLAAHAAIAIDNARVYKLVERQRSELRRLLAKQIIVQEEERQRIALDVHDTIIQSLIAALQKIRDPDGMSHPNGTRAVEQLLRGAIDELRLMVSNLRPATLDTFGLVPALEVALQNFERQELIVTRLDVRGTPRPLNQAAEISVYRIVLEALANVRKHAQASSVSLSLTFEPDSVLLVIEDDGVGIGSELRDAVTFGIGGMEERAALVGGSFSIGPGPARGTRVEVRMPTAERART